MALCQKLCSEVFIKLKIILENYSFQEPFKPPPPPFLPSEGKTCKEKRLTEFKSRIVYWIKFQKWEQEKQEKTKEMMINSERSSLVGNEANIKISIYKCITND